MSDLKPCPFCGSERVKVFACSDGGICVMCLDCLCQTHAISDLTIDQCERINALERVVKAWNTRKGERDE